MFQLPRFDPRKEAQRKATTTTTTTKKNKKTKRKRVEEDAQDHKKQVLPSTTATKVPSTISKEKKLTTLLETEAFDDLDLIDKDDVLPDDGAGDGDNDDYGLGDGVANHTAHSTDDVQGPDQSITAAAKRWGLAPFLVSNLERDGFEKFFPIQAAIIPEFILAEQHMAGQQTYDLMCAAPTGSGKTLAFVLPVLNALAHRRVRRLRALVILPSRDLAQQVFDVFKSYVEGSPNNVTIGLAIGQSDFKAEQRELMFGKKESTSLGSDNGLTRRFYSSLRHTIDPGNLDLALDAMADSLNDPRAFGRDRRDAKADIPSGGISGVDVLVCTPGRLVDHLDNTPGFTLQHLRWLVIDEADRLMSQSYHGWIQRVLDSVHAPPSTTVTSSGKKAIDPITFRRTATDGAPHTNSICQRVQLRKLLYSATLTKDPQKLASLRLVNPKYFNAHNLSGSLTKHLEGSLYQVPETLQEYTVECTAEQKPIALLALLLERLQNTGKPKEKHMIVVFTSSLESTHRLTRLLQLLWQSAGYSESPMESPMEFSSSLNQQQRSHLMNRCNDPNDASVNVLVCSDGMSRGMDLDSVRTVIHYDVPGMAKTYVHRCGRTARAGHHGEAIALLKGKGQAGQFARLRRLIANPQDQVKPAKINTSLVRGTIPLYKECIRSLKEVLAAESRQELKHTDPDLSQYLPGSMDAASNSNQEESDSQSDSQSDSLSD